ncbi:hypothetical protein [Cellulomonas fimi]|uniref:Uncharacterized protein n=1 Tax=Cellulomonas fimi TaxID=1708 RepID=A0A7Y0QFN4_CELFI|nr:hypothetical protein [Cellulomonas fimi]NMR19231.1 hypothetical protein [Cellulomonas fimi]
MDTVDEVRSARTRKRLRDDRNLLEELGRIDACGWDDPVATALLTFVREDLVRPMVVAEGLRGLAASQAEATGWETAWETLRAPSLRQAASPWGVVWVAVQRAVRGEALAARYCTTSIKAWRARSDARTGAVPMVVSLDRLLDVGLEPAPQQPVGAGIALGPGLEVIVGAMVHAGWQLETAARLVRVLAEIPVHDVDGTRAKAGWRPLAAELGLPPWQVRRTMVLLLGEPGWDGLLPRVRREGAGVLDDVGVQAAVRSTAVEWMRPPRRVAALALRRDARKRERAS